MARESMPYDVVIVGAGPAGLSAACRLKQIDTNLSVCVVEKGSEVGAHILSGAVFEPRALAELFPDYLERGAPLLTPVTSDEIYVFQSGEKSLKVPAFLTPSTMHNQGNYIISLGNLCRWLAEQAEALGVEIFPGFAAAEVLYDGDNRVIGIATGDMGVSATGEAKDTHMPGMELHAKYTLFAEGCRGELGKQLIAKFNLSQGMDPQHYGLGIKELWEIPEKNHRAGLVVHTAGWPLTETGSTGGGFLYHVGKNQIAVGLITDLSYSNPLVNPFEEFQRYKHQPQIQKHLAGGKRVAYGARAIAKGGLQSLPRMIFPGGLLIGDDAGTLNFAKIKGTHTAMKSALVAAESVAHAIIDNRAHDQLDEFEDAWRNSWAWQELYQQRNFGPALHKWGTVLGAAYAYLDINIFRGRLPWTLSDPIPDHAALKPKAKVEPITYPKPDSILSFDLPSSVYLANTSHEEDQPCHLRLASPELPMQKNYPIYGEPAQRYCPAGVYEVLENAGGDAYLQINAQNCIHCKTCDIKDPQQNITWVSPEGGGGPNYPSM
ncbi:electron transfer flavoprotein-ubiquinone oxidoreductase [Marinimicrobium sp. ABcell2]|uniref:electron transfer flavoprotein-ubiquinone oxidoreductase n=1 Tax=Marinimicrobium sp. ABcell2 TaxID=3069751 RepID=UPI0027AFBD50|nr:electron transfer flavoprotein-ubiquinone oxidoreductase [Marinimicrobium sp. ABcell2]MDQ2078030.1 electron transfer flavoprotein-ubiquinone oxidoreductase [Marinimicrobium sp. ABcell2]